MKKKIIIGNWKMNPVTIEDAKSIFKATKSAAEKSKSLDVIVCPPFVYLSTVLKTESESVSIGSQDSFFESQGSFTGEISPLMLKNMGVKYSIVGHSEKRAKGDTDENISKKVAMLLDLGIKAILCFGEKERSEDGAHLDFLKNQIKNSLNKVSRKNINNLIIAYEPVWAIGAKEAMQPADIYEMSIFIRKILSDLYGHDTAVATPVLYGGSVNFRNAAEIFTKGQIDGLLVGRESVNISGFKELLKAVDSI